MFLADGQTDILRRRLKIIENSSDGNIALDALSDTWSPSSQNTGAAKEETKGMISCLLQINHSVRNVTFICRLQLAESLDGKVLYLPRFYTDAGGRESYDCRMRVYLFSVTDID